MLKLGAEFKVGEKVVYPAHGVGVIESIQTEDDLRHRAEVLHAPHPRQRHDHHDPDRERRHRRAAAHHRQGHGPKVYKILRDKKVEIDQQTWNRRYREYTEKIKTGSVLEIAKVLRDLFVLKGDKELSFGERKMLDTARNLLVKELAIAKLVPRGEDHGGAEDDLRPPLGERMVFQPTRGAGSDLDPSRCFERLRERLSANSFP